MPPKNKSGEKAPNPAESSTATATGRWCVDFYYYWSICWYGQPQTFEIKSQWCRSSTRISPLTLQQWSRRLLKIEFRNMATWPLNAYSTTSLIHWASSRVNLPGGLRKDCVIWVTSLMRLSPPFRITITTYFILVSSRHSLHQSVEGFADCVDTYDIKNLPLISTTRFKILPIGTNWKEELMICRSTCLTWIDLSIIYH